ncbi:SGNH/GDSL hydrolase family protein [Desulfosporosinus sp. OT]|uniref:SGNH/GDSL hydrolase family protein n=1 Tax=Desulfosporosinus sp. OT TaxID=913865 RepID=UPI000312F1CD|nr:SGNH/GDSL hydrolase family protein [Desulfosporosinus sp. OT]
MENRFLLTLDFKRRTIRNINFVQNNVGTSVIEFSIVDGGQTTGPDGQLTGGNVVDITGQAISIAFLKPDKTIVIQDETTGVSILDAPNGKLECVLMSNTLAAAGVIKAEISFSKDGNKLSTTQFNFTCSSSLDNGDGILSSNLVPFVDAKVVEWQAEFDVITAQYETATTQNTDIEIVAARGGEVNLGARLDAADASFSTYKAQTANNIKLNSILNYGGNPDGITPVDTAWNNAKTKGTVYFPQNTTGNAQYYFTNQPSLNEVIIHADAGVILSFPTTNVTTFRDVVFTDDIIIYSRDRDNYANVLKNDYSKSAYMYSMDNDIDIGIKKLTLVDDGAVRKKIVWNGDSLPADKSDVDTSEITLIDGFYQVSNTAQVTNLSKWYVTSLPIELNTVLNCLIKPRYIETQGGARLGVYFGDNLYNFINHIDYAGNIYGWKMENGIWATIPPNLTYKDLLTPAYKDINSIQISIRAITQRKFDMFINGVLVASTELEFDCKEFGFALLTSNNVNSGINNFTWGEITKGYARKVNSGNTFNAIAFGDSITFGADSSISWPNALKNIVEGQYGINKFEINNQGVGGHKAANQLAIMQGIDLTSYDTVFILIGTNDIGVTPITDFELQVQSMIDLANGKRVIIGIPPMFITSVLTGGGIEMTSYTKGAPYRNSLLKLIAQNNVYLADTLSEIGRIGVDNTLTYVLRDNLHPQTWGYQMLARCFARTFLTAINQYATMEEIVESVLKKYSIIP